MHRISAEQRVVCEVLKGASEVKLPGVADAKFSTEVDASVLLDLFQRHRILSLSSQIRSQLPPREKQTWKSLVQQRTMRSLKLFEETLNLINVLKEAGIEAIPLKGAFLGYQLYNDPGKRHFNDVDLLINPEDLEKVTEILANQGYQKVYPAPLNERQFKTYSFYKKDIGLRNPEKNVFIELHYGFHVHRLLKKADEAALRQNRETIHIKNEPYQVLDAETTFFYLVFHGCLHQYFRLFWLKDIADWMQTHDLHYQKVKELFKTTGLERMLFVTLQLLKDYFNKELPEELTATDFYTSKLFKNSNSYSKRINRLVNICHMRIQGMENETTRLKFARHYFLLNLKPGLAYKFTVLWSILQRKRIRKYMGGN